MNHLAYIPKKEDKKELQKMLQESPKRPLKETIEPIEIDRENSDKESKALNKQQLSAMVTRLTKITKKQYQIQQQAAHILQVNKELQKKRINGDKVENRLIARGKQKEKKIVQLAQHLQKQKQEKYYRDIPEISKKGHQVQQKTIDRRLDELIHSRQLKKQELKTKYEPSFHPKVDSHSQFINDIQNLGDLHNRMHVKEKQAGKRKTSILQKVTEEEEQKLTFRPKINQKSREIAENLPVRNISGTAFDNLPSEQSQIYPFTPAINKNTDRYLSNREKGEDCFRRLYNQAKQLTKKKQNEINSRNRSNSFKPSLNNKSMKIASSLQEKDKKLETKTCSLTVPSKDEQFYEEVKVGNPKCRTYSLRTSTTRKKHWIQNLEQPVLREVISNNRNKTTLMR